MNTIAPKAPFSIKQGYHPGLIGRVVTLHGRAYVEKWKFWKFFECKVAAELSIFMECFDPAHSNIWSVELDGEIYGSITIDGSRASEEGAHLRWFILDEKAKGKGLGKALLETAIAFCRAKGFTSIYLWTIEGLEPAGSLYRKMGFELEESRLADQWGQTVQEEKLRLQL